MSTLHASVKIWAIRLGAALLLSFLGVGLINSKVFDEALNPELQAYLSRFPNSDVHDNAFTVLYGLMASSNKDMKEVGRSVVLALKDKHQQGLPVALNEEEMLQLHGERLLDIEWRQHYAALNCLPGTFTMCWPDLVREVQMQPLSGESIRLAYARYEQLIAMPHHIEFIEMDRHTPLPPFNELLAIGKLRLAELIAQGDPQEALQLLEKEMRFWRMVLRESQSIIGKMVAVRGFSDRIQFISQVLLVSPHEGDELLNKLKEMVTPLTQEELDISEAVLHDLRVVYSMQELDSGIDHGKIGEALIAWSTQEIASYNTYFEEFIKPSMALSKLDSPSFKREHALFRIGLEQSSNTFMPNIYNPGGELIVSELYYDESPYMARVHDLNGMFILLNLKLELMHNSHLSVENFIKNGRFKNPYTHEAFAYSERENRVSFHCESDFSGCEIGL